MHTFEHLDPTWNLEGLFPGGSESPEFACYLEALEAEIRALADKIGAQQVPEGLAEALAWSDLLEAVQQVAGRLRQGYAFVSCLTAQNVRDQKAKLLQGTMSQLGAALAATVTDLDAQILQIPDGLWAALIAQERFAAIRFPLEERRRRAREKFVPAMESLVGDLAVDGYHGWSDLYNTVVGRMSAEVEKDGRTLLLSMGQLANRMSSGDRGIRADAFAGHASNISTLAHELGHAYHQHVMDDLPQAAQGYAMNVAETASTFAELIVDAAALQQAASAEERIALLAEKAERAVTFFMNIHARFLFETRFYAERRRSMLSVDRLGELMVTAQKEAYRDALASYHPTFWASKLHFYSTGQPFYNFPYTFGFLFSAGVYARAIAEGAGFANRYVDLLRDTGRMRVEDLALRHLGADLTRPEFWQHAVDLSVADIQQFLRLTAPA